MAFFSTFGRLPFLKQNQQTSGCGGFDTTSKHFLRIFLTILCYNVLDQNCLHFFKDFYKKLRSLWPCLVAQLSLDGPASAEFGLAFPVLLLFQN